MPALSSCLLMRFIHLSKAVLMVKSTSLITVIVHGSKVLSPATFKLNIPLKGMLMGAISEMEEAALTKNLVLSIKHLWLFLLG